MCRSLFPCAFHRVGDTARAGLDVHLGPAWVPAVLAGVVAVVMTFRSYKRLDTDGGVWEPLPSLLVSGSAAAANAGLLLSCMSDPTRDLGAAEGSLGELACPDHKHFARLTQAAGAMVITSSRGGSFTKEHTVSVSAETVVARVPRRFAVGHPMAAFLLIALPLAWINMFIPLLAGWRLGSSTLVGALLGGLVGGAVVVSALTGGRAAVRRPSEV